MGDFGQAIAWAFWLIWAALLAGLVLVAFALTFAARWLGFSPWWGVALAVVLFVATWLWLLWRSGAFRSFMERG